ncbi:MAG TPA: helix-turn-helix transcriptional regulator [Pseudonocardia sp.]
MSSPSPLSGRLRDLRTTSFGTPVIQKVLATALRVSPPTISSWENGTAVPLQDRLEELARFFATPRSMTEERLLAVADLTPEENVQRERLLAELLALRPQDFADPGGRPALGEPDFWHFPDGGPVRIVCGQRDDPPPEASGNHPNYMALASYADLDSLVELFGHLRSRNPGADVRFLRPELLRDDDLHAHLVFLGNMATLQARIKDWWSGLPVTQVRVPEIKDGEVFEVRDAEGHVNRYGPVLSGDPATVVEDVGFLARMPSPNDPDRTLTICSGVFTRGVFGAVRCLTDQGVTRANHAYLRSRFDGASTFGVLMRVLVGQRLLATPRLDDERARLFEFP